MAERVAAAAPTLLIVGGDDGQVIELNEFALRRMHTAMQTAERPLEVQLKIIPGATHLFGSAWRARAGRGAVS